ncbi:DUF2207 domain-containing protein [Patescibacteria group bacterium]|nr:DUF2207 domain-containing protein [Patescibacteria group bacterium]MBU1906679.1 DUF2207 domain-containing protein [Patescibacteria group bacterium]
MTNIFRTKQLICASLLALLITVLVPIGVAHAQEAFIFYDFSVGIEVHEDSTLDVRESILVEFFEERHGLFRVIPVDYKGRFGENVTLDVNVISVTDQDGQSLNFETYREGDNLVVKIGSADVTVLGPQEYNLHYQVNRALLYFDDHDELYWNVTGTDWGTDIPSSSVSVQLPASVDDGIDIVCFTGSFGSQAQDCTRRVVTNIASANANDFMTVAVSWPKGHVAEPGIAARIWQFIQDNGIILMPIAVFLALLAYWSKYGRDERGRVTIVPEYDPPKNLSVMEVGTLIDTKVHSHDISAGIINLAVNGYLKIKEEEEKKLLGKKKVFTFIKTNKLPGAELDKSEHDLYTGIFDGKDEVKLDELKGEFHKTVAKINKGLYQQMATKKLFAKNPNTIRGTFITIGTVVAMSSFWLGAFGFHVAISLVLSGLLIIGFAFIMAKKTREGTLAYEQAKGFKMFLEKAEKYRIEWQERENMFESYLPYAMVFGVADKWTNAFKDKIKQNPDWYQGDPGAFTRGYFIGSLNDFSNSMSAASAPPSKGAAGGSSGFGGGGFSGGGFGGGGGGSW